MGIVVGILLLSCIRSEIYVTSYLLPVNGRHFEFTLRFLSAVIAVISGNTAVLKSKFHHCIVHHIGHLHYLSIQKLRLKKLLPTFVPEVATE